MDRSLGDVLSMAMLTTRPLQPLLSFMTNPDGAADGGAANEATGRVSARRSQTRPAEWWLSGGYKA